jgi:copper chaperone
MTTATQQLTYSVPGIGCEHCRTTITNELRHVSGVLAVDVDLTGKRVTVTGSGLDDGAIRDAIDEAGYDTA